LLNAASDLLLRLRDCGARVDVIGETLQVASPVGLTKVLKEQVVALKPQLLKLLADSVELLNHRGARLVNHDGRTTIGIWRDAHSQQVREALDALGLGAAEVFYLDDPESDIPWRYREFVSEYVKAIWAKQGLLASPAERLKAAAKARYLNRLFDTLGTGPGRVASRPRQCCTAC
jgi:hypothetical protein